VRTQRACFGVTKIFKETLIEGHKKPSHTNIPIPSRSPVSRDRSFASVARGQLGGSPDSPLMRWKCRDRGSWDVCAAVIGKVHNGSGNMLKQKVSFKDNVNDVSVSPRMKGDSKEFMESSSPCINQFQVLRDLLENYPSSDCECSSHCSSPCASRVPESPLNVVEELHPAARSSATSVVVYSRRKKLGKTKLAIDAGSGSPNMQEVGGSSLLENTQGLDDATLVGSAYSGNVSEGSAWVLERMIFFCKKMGLAIEGREMELLSFLASLEANRMKGDQLVEESRGDAVARDRLSSDGAIR